MDPAQDAHEPAIAQLGVWHLVACAALLVVVVAASASLELGLESRLVVSALRCATLRVPPRTPAFMNASSPA